MKNKWTLEILWWIFTGIVTLSVLFPILYRIEGYPFYCSNIIFIVTFITLARYIFLLPYTFLAHRQILKTALVFLSIPGVFLLIQELNLFQTFIDEQGIEAVVGHLPAQDSINMLEYVRSEMILFGVGSIISGILFPLRMIISVWRYRNRGKI